MNKGRVVLTQYSLTEDMQKVTAVYLVEQNNGATSVEQKLTLTGDVGFLSQSWRAEIELSDFPMQKTPKGAALKLSDWLDRLSAAIKSGDYELPSSSADFVELS